MSGAIGISIGSQNIVIASASKCSIDVLTNDLSSKSTPSVVCFTPKQRLIGESGYTRLITNFKNTILSPTRFLGIKSNDHHLDKEKNWISHELNIEGPEILHEIYYGGEKRHFKTEQVVGSLLKHLKDIISDKNNIKMTDCVVSVPGYYNEIERIALLDAIRIAEIPCIKIMNEGTAAALNYAFYNNVYFSNTPRVVSFADLGHSKFSVTIVQFIKDQLQILAHVSERNLGCRDFDWALMTHFAKCFKKSHIIDIIKDQKAKIKLRQETEKLRKMLTTSNEGLLKIDNIVNRYNLKQAITREEFENISIDLLNKIDTICTKALQTAGVDNVYSVEVLGGGSRMPSVQKVYAKAFNVPNINENVGLEELVSRGCAIEAAILSPHLKVREFIVRDIVYYPIKFAYSLSGVEDFSDYYMLFNEKTVFPMKKNVKMRKNGPFRVRFCNETCSLCTSVFIECPEEPENYGINLQIEIDKNGVLSINSAERVIEAESKEEKTSPDSGKSSLEETKDNAIRPIQNTYKTHFNCILEQRGLDDQTIRIFIEQENKFVAQGYYNKIILEKKKELESYVDSSLSSIKTFLNCFVTPENAYKILNDIEEIETWLDDDYIDSTTEEYESRLSFLQSSMEPILKRWAFYTGIPSVIESFEKCLKYAYHMISEFKVSFSDSCEEEIKYFLRKTQEDEEVLKHVKESLTELEWSQDPGMSLEYLEEKANELKDLTYQYINKYKEKLHESKTKNIEDKP